MHTYKGRCPLTLFPPLNFQNLNVLPSYLRLRVSDQWQRELQKMWLSEKERENNLEEPQVIRNPTEIKKMSPSQVLYFLNFVPAYKLCRERLVLISARSLGLALVFADLSLTPRTGGRKPCPWYASAQTRGTEWPGGISIVDAAAVSE